tara:strand:- start:18 stop:158 length:141 start_codon:yes stop_codon:yes gene_type:complete
MFHHRHHQHWLPHKLLVLLLKYYFHLYHRQILMHNFLKKLNLLHQL